MACASAFGAFLLFLADENPCLRGEPDVARHGQEVVRTHVPVDLGDQRWPGLVADQLRDFRVGQAALPGLCDKITPQALRGYMRQLQRLAGRFQPPTIVGVITRLLRIKG